VGTGIQAAPRSHDDQHPRGERRERADRVERDGALHPPGLSQRQAAQGRAGPRSTLQAWRADQERRAAWPAGVACVPRVPGLACLAWCWRSPWSVPPWGPGGLAWGVWG
jgi:hypothetical protein